MVQRTMVGAALAVAVACGGSEPTTPAPVEAPGAPLAASHDAGPGDLPAPVAEALEGVFPDARRVRCAHPPELLGGEGALSGVWLGPSELFLDAPTVAGGFVAAVVPAPKGRALLLRDGQAAAMLSWDGARSGAWTACTVAPAARFEILGLVADPAGRELEGVTVRGCEPGVVTTTNAQGRFTLQGVVGRDCPLLAVVDDGGRLGRSEVQVVRSDGADVITEIALPAERLDPATVPAHARRWHGLLELQLRNGVEAEVEGLRGRVAAADLSPAAARVGAGWLADLDARAQRVRDLLPGLERADQDGLVAYWLGDL